MKLQRRIVLKFSNVNKISSLCKAQNNFLIKDKSMIVLCAIAFMTMMGNFMLVSRIGCGFVIFVMMMRNNSMGQQYDVGRKKKQGCCYFFHPNE